jgi:hypothetical protein
MKHESQHNCMLPTAPSLPYDTATIRQSNRAARQSRMPVRQKRHAGIVGRWAAQALPIGISDSGY